MFYLLNEVRGTGLVLMESPVIPASYNLRAACCSNISWIFFRLSFIDSMRVLSSSIASRKFVRSVVTLLNLLSVSRSLGAICLAGCWASGEIWTSSSIAIWAGLSWWSGPKAGMSYYRAVALPCPWVPYGFDAVWRLVAAFAPVPRSFSMWFFTYGMLCCMCF